MLALRSHSRPCLIAPQRCARLPAPPLTRAALSLASRAPHPRPSLPRSSAATYARLRRVLRSISSPPCSIHAPPRCKRGTSARNQQWILTSRTIYKSRPPLASGSAAPTRPEDPSGWTEERPHDEADATPVTAPPAPAPAPASAEAGTGAEADVPATTRAQRMASRRGVSGAGRVAGCPGTASPPLRQTRHALASPLSRPPRHALAMRPPQKTRPFSFLNHLRADRRRSSRERGSAHSSIKTGGVKKPSFSG